MNTQIRLRVCAIVLALLFSLALAGDIWVSPSGASSWDGDCSTSSPCSQATPCALSGTSITSVEGSVCTLHVAGGDYGSSVHSLSFEPTVASTLVLTSADSAVATILLHIDAHANALNIAGFNAQSSDLLFTSSNTATMVIENSNFELLGSDGSTTIGFARDTSAVLSTLVRNSTFISTSDSIYYLTSFNLQDLTIEGSTFEAREVAILGASNTLSITGSTFRTPSLYQGEVAQVYLSGSTFTTVSESMLLSTTTLTNLSIVNGCSITGAGGFVAPDQLLSDPSLNLLAAVDVQSSTFGASFTLGNLFLASDATVTINNASFAEVAASIILGGSNHLTITANTFARKYNAPILAISASSLDLPSAPIALYGNSFSSAAKLTSAAISLTNVTSFDALTNVTVDSIQIIGNVTVSGIWEIHNSISGSASPSSIDFLVASAVQRPTMTVYSISVKNVSLDLQAAASLSYTVTNATTGIQGPNATQGYAIYLSQAPVVTWNEKSIGFLPALGTSYILASSLSSVPIQDYEFVGRYNYSIVQGNDTHTANLVFGKVSCPLACYSDYTLPACVDTRRCSCIASFGGPYCKCNMTGMPAAAECSESGDPEWFFASSAVLSSLTLPNAQSIVSNGDLDVTGAFNIPSGAQLTLAGALRLGGAVKIVSSTAWSVTSSGCHLITDAHIESRGLVLNATARINVTLDLSGISNNLICNATGASEFATFSSLGASSDLSPSAVIAVNFTSPGNFSKKDVMQALESQLSVSLRLIDAASASNAANPRVTVNGVDGSCTSTSTSTPGIVDLMVRPCSTIVPSGAPSNGKGSKVLWWYWGIPVIVVGAILIVVLVVLLAVRPCCKK